MSSSPPKSRRSKTSRGALRTCLACGLRRVERRVVEVKWGNGRVVRGVEADVCANCGKRYFDMDAMDKIEAVTYPRSGSIR